MRCPKARKLISLYVGPEPSWLCLKGRQALEAHMAVCEACRQDCRESQEAMGLLYACWQISADTTALLEKGHQRNWHGSSTWVVPLRTFRRVAAAVLAAGLVLTVLGGWAIFPWKVSWRGSDRPVAPPGMDRPLVIASTDGRPITAGTMVQTLAGETKGLVLNGRHQVVVNADSRLAIEPMVERGRMGYAVNLVLGEVYVHVEHDGVPFVVRTAHGRAVVTGTTFDVKAREAGTVLLVVEGSVQFESETNAVQVTAGKQSTIVAASGSPSTPVVCDIAALTAWARPDPSTTEMVRLASPQSDDLPPFSSASIATRLEHIDYAAWVEENRDWFRHQFPEIFRLKEALAGEGVEVDYPRLLLESGVVWQFAWPPADGNRLPPVDDRATIQAANHYGKNLQWLKDRKLLRGTSGAAAEQTFGVEPFTLWQKELDTVLGVHKAVPAGVLFSSLHACDYLRRVRSLIWLAVEAEQHSLSNVPKLQLLDVLQEEVAVADRCTQDCLRLLAVEKSNVSCDSDQYQELVQKLHDTIAKMARIEGRIENETAGRHP